jgi:hypothetical protein
MKRRQEPFPIPRHLRSGFAPLGALVAAALALAGLAPLNTTARPEASSVEVFKLMELGPGEKREVHFRGPAALQGQDIVLLLRARLDTPKVAGYAPALRLTLNGQILEVKRLLNRQREETRIDGLVIAANDGDTFNTPYAPDFDAPDRHPHYALRSQARQCQFDLRVTDLVRPEDNVLTIQNDVPPEIKESLVVGDGKIEISAPAPSKVLKPAPVGPIPVVEPATTFNVAYTLTQDPDGSMELTIGQERFRVESEFSTPQPAWVNRSNRYFDFSREVEKKGEAIIVRDTFTNLTAENLPLMQRHRVLTDRPFKKVWLSGIAPTALTASSSDAANPTSYGVTGASGVGVMALDDALQLHVANFSTENQVGLEDSSFALKPGARHTSEWAILPTAVPDYYVFLNAARRLRDANFTLDGSFAFLRADPREPTDKWTDQQFSDFIRFKNAHFVCDYYYSYPRYQGQFPFGTALQLLDFSYLKRQMERLRRLVPESRHVTYFHCFIDVLDEAPDVYSDSRQLSENGQQEVYEQNPYDRLFVPTETNSFGRDVAKNVDLIIGPPPNGFGCDGVYWDEFEHSEYEYHYADFSSPNPGLPWDGVSADIDPKTLRIVRLKSHVALLSQSYRLALARRILKDKALIGNGQPHTRTIASLHFPRFVETDEISNCANAQIFSPIALGDHLTEQDEEDAYNDMLQALEYGCLYYWYSDLKVIPTHPHLTSYMFPITPIELHQGYIIGRERIITSRSGLFGWGDNSTHEVHVFNEQGKEVLDFMAPTVEKEGRTFTELRLPEDWSAAIIRKAV